MSSKMEKIFEEILTEESQDENKTADTIFSEIENGFGKLHILIEKYNNYFEKSEINGKIKIQESREGDLLKEQIKLWTEYIQSRIDDLKNKAKTEFDTELSARRTRNINRYSQNINAIKIDIFSENTIEANITIKSPESNEIYRQCFSYINLIKDLNKIIEKHNKYFTKLGRQEQIIDFRRK
jgi:hypothetical protein